MKFEHWDLTDHEKFPHLVTKKLMCEKINAMAGMIELDPHKWLRGVEKVGLLKLLWVLHYHHALVTAFVIR